MSTIDEAAASATGRTSRQEMCDLALPIEVFPGLRVWVNRLARLLLLQLYACRNTVYWSVAAANRNSDYMIMSRPSAF